VIILLLKLFFFISFIFFPLKLLIFGGCIGPPKITLNTFGGRALAVENNVFSTVKARPPKINFYFWLFCSKKPPKITHFRRQKVVSGFWPLKMLVAGIVIYLIWLDSYRLAFAKKNQWEPGYMTPTPHTVQLI
jgi:hypothetical protein